MKLREYRVTKMLLNEQPTLLVVCENYKTAAELFQTTVNYIGRYGTNYPARTQIAIDNPGVVYGFCDSGNLVMQYPELRNKIMPKEELYGLIKTLNVYDRK